MPLPRKREFECYLNEGTLKDLIIAHLHQIRVIRDYEEVENVSIDLTGKLEDGCHKLRIRFEPDVQVIFHHE